MTTTTLPPVADDASCPRALRQAVRAGAHTGPTGGLCDGFLQGNLVILPEAEAEDFDLFCARNAQALPRLARGRTGDPRLPTLGHDIDIRRDIPGYCVFRDRIRVAEPPEISQLWRDDLVSFVLGCSFSFEAALSAAGIPMRHIAQGRNIAMFRSNIDTIPAGPFGGKLVVSMRHIPSDRLEDVRAICAGFPLAHGAPVHMGDPAAIGIPDLARPDWGEATAPEPGDIPVFWACGVTGQQALLHAKLPFAITHQPGHMLVTDLIASAPVPV